MKHRIPTLLIGLLLGAVLFGNGSALAAGLMAEPSSQTFYVDDRPVFLQAYQINGNNYVKLRDIGQAVDFGVTYDSATNTVCISPDKPYETEVTTSATTPAATSQTSPSTLNKNTDGSINVPQDGSQYVPQVGDVIRCDDGTNYTITDVSRYDKNYFASGPVGPLPTATCDWSQFYQPELPRAEVRHYSLQTGEYIFVQNLYETRRVLYTLYNAMGEDDWIMQGGTPRLRGDGTPWVHIQLTVPSGVESAPFWPWQEDYVTAALHSCPGGEFYTEVWDVFKDGKFQRTEYHLCK